MAAITFTTITSNITWHTQGAILPVSGSAPIGAVLQQIESESPAWLVIGTTAESKFKAPCYVIAVESFLAFASIYSTGTTSAQPSPAIGWALQLTGHDTAILVETWEDATTEAKKAQSGERWQWPYRRDSGLSRSGVLRNACLLVDANGWPRRIGWYPVPADTQYQQRQQQQHQQQQQQQQQRQEQQQQQQQRQEQQQQQQQRQQQEQQQQQRHEPQQIQLRELLCSFPAQAAESAQVGPGVPASGFVDGDDEATQRRLARFSGSAPTQVHLGVDYIIDLRIDADISVNAQQDGAWFANTITRDDDLEIWVSVERGGKPAYGQRTFKVRPPKAGQAIQASVQLSPLEEGEMPVFIKFRQSEDWLAELHFSVQVVPATETLSTKRAGAVVAQQPRIISDKSSIELWIEQQQVGLELRYRYLLFANNLGLGLNEFRSPPLLEAVGGGNAATLMNYVDNLYRRLEQEVITLRDAEILQLTIQALGQQIADELFDPEFVRLLWPHRENIRTIKVIAWEAYIPWEMLRLRHPDTREVDDRYLCEYGLIRQIRGQKTTPSLRLRDWSYLQAHYPANTEPPVDGATNFLRHNLAGYGITATRIGNDYASAMRALQGGGFDVLHIACHGNAKHGDINNSKLIIGETPDGTGNDVPVTLNSLMVSQAADLSSRKPIVFLNACESGRLGPSLTAWGGWPAAFIKVGASVFVGTSWPVREVPATAFATAFYSRLLDGATLSEATRAARSAAKNLPDASWLAYKVFGDPDARMDS